MNIVTDAQGDVIGFTVPGEGVWTVNKTTGAVTFNPDPTFTDDPTPIDYMVDDNAHVISNQSTIVIKYIDVFPIELLSLKAHIDQNRIKLTWKVINEKGFSHFDTQKSTDAKELM